MRNSFSSYSSEAEFFLGACIACEEAPRGHNNALQIAPFSASIPSRSDTISEIIELREAIRRCIPDLIDFGSNRAKRAFESQFDRLTKPSYSGRLRGTSGEKVDQITQIVQTASNERKSGGLVFSVFLPSDHLRKKRPGYVPCLVSGSFSKIKRGFT